MRRLALLAFSCLLVAACDRTQPSPATPAAEATPAAAESVAAPEAVAATALTALTAEQAAVQPIMSPTCNLESVDGVLVPDSNPITAKSRDVAVSGWIYDDATVPSALAVRIYSTSGDGRIWEYATSPTIDREDVQKVQGGAPGVLRSGFSGQMDLSQLPPGRYSLRLAYDRAGTSVMCDNGRALILN